MYVDSSLVYFSEQCSIRSMEVVVKKFVDQYVPSQLGQQTS